MPAFCFDSAEELRAALEETAVAHHVYEEENGEPDPDWARWYANRIARRQGSFSRA